MVSFVQATSSDGHKGHSDEPLLQHVFGHVSPSSRVSSHWHQLGSSSNTPKHHCLHHFLWIQPRTCTHTLLHTTRALASTIKFSNQVFVLSNLHFASPLAKQNEKQHESMKHKSIVVGEMIAFSICNKPFKPLGIPSG